MQEIKIEKGVPFPPRTRAKGYTKYPFPKMAIGDSFIYPKDGYTTYVARVRILVAINYWKKATGSSWKFKTSLTESGEIRIWRIK